VIQPPFSPTAICVVPPNMESKYPSIEERPETKITLWPIFVRWRKALNASRLIRPIPFSVMVPSISTRISNQIIIAP
jgi:hypothetical protein